MTASAVRFDVDISGYETQFKVLSFSSTEGISQLFRIDLFITTESSNIDLEKIPGKPIVFSISTGDDTRYMSGIVSRFWWMSESGDLSAYYCEMIPIHWRLDRRSDCRIFQNRTVPQIIQRVLEDAHIPSDACNLKMLRKKYTPREYCVQYQETDFSFISRLMEEEGIFYFFQHHYDASKKRGRHVMMLGDDPSCHPSIAGKEKVIYTEPGGQVPAEEYIYEFQFGRQTSPGAVTLRDYNYQRPDLALQGTAAGKESDHLCLYRYPGGFNSQSAGSEKARLWLEEVQTTSRLGSGRSVCCRLLPGSYFRLADHPQKSFNREYRALSINQNGAQREVSSESQNSDLEELLQVGMNFMPALPFVPFSVGEIYSTLKSGLDWLFGKQKEYYYGNQFLCIPLATPFRPQYKTPKPSIQGPQTAKVVATGQEKIHMDSLGRIKVKFHWDRTDQDDDAKRTCYIRAAYNYAGGNHGIQFPALPGDEVVVDFINGDPDKPLITGAVYNSLNNPPLKPEEMIENTILTPYQHRLLFSDRNQSVTLNTGRNEMIEMIDEEPSTEFGNQIRITTADHHSMHMSKGTRLSGINVATESGQKIVLQDQPGPSGILLEDKNGVLALQFNSDEKIIQLKNTTGSEIQINCSKGTVSVIGGDVEVIGGNVTVNGSDTVDIKSGGQVKIQAPSIEATADGTIKLAAPDITLEGAQINLQAPLVEAAQILNVGSLLSTEILVAKTNVLSPSYSPGVGNLL